VIHVVLAAEYPEVVPTVARWHWEWWDRSVPGGSVESWMEELAGFAQAEHLPVLMVALDDGEPVGCVSLVEHDMSRAGDPADGPPPAKWRKHRPWLSSLYVVQTHRRQGIGTALVERCCVTARTLGETRLFLYTSGADRFYSRLGWTSVGRDEYEGETVTIMTAPLSTSP
jgi:predicted N-acetyltransferase YhbS